MTSGFNKTGDRLIPLIDQEITFFRKHGLPLIKPNATHNRNYSFLWLVGTLIDGLRHMGDETDKPYKILHALYTNETKRWAVKSLWILYYHDKHDLIDREAFAEGIKDIVGPEVWNNG